MVSTTCNSGAVLDVQSSAEAELYVDSIMSSQRITRVESPPRSGRKRHLSLPSGQDSTVKKAKLPEIGGRVMTTAKRSLEQSDSNRAVPNTTDRSIVITEADVHVDSEPTVKELIAKMSSDMHMMFTCLAERIDKLESGLEERISTKVAQLLDKRVNNELGRIKRDIDARLDTFNDTMRIDIGDELDVIRKKS